MFGVICGGLAAILYTAANVALRQSVGVDPFLVAAVKAVPTVLFLGPFLVWLVARGKKLMTSSRMIVRFLIVALVGQFVGNAAFQVALEVIGLAISVPITLGVLIIGGAILGRIVLGEPVRINKVIAIVILISAIVILSLPSAGERPLASSSTLPIWVGALCAAASGAAYSLFGVVMRQTMHSGVSASLTMFLSGAVGVLSLWTFVLTRIELSDFNAIATEQWVVMSAAGLLNFSAFIAMSLSLKALPVVAVNLINASQVAMAALAGVILFAEPITAALVSGVTLTFAGLLVLAFGRK
ncbi:DMT family transporter [Rubripirellula amarantea]|uniref:EamA-like transporter family protein n=1 Tax=Rubripirellula amarantea TaxID=2527999 RepID=A0A5C5WS60_9BACT|nr:DMT family transporter [Rubripirellula amarantea]MDA8744452.1 DMT family transporter [Rubripirellula amarantea]TWT53320.1 EamA-like transporter family protein [Rubripirellula amarantea]